MDWNERASHMQTAMLFLVLGFLLGGLCTFALLGQQQQQPLEKPAEQVTSAPQEIEPICMKGESVNEYMVLRNDLSLVVSNNKGMPPDPLIVSHGRYRWRTSPSGVRRLYVFYRRNMEEQVVTYDFEEKSYMQQFDDHFLPSSFWFCDCSNVPASVLEAKPE